MRYLVTGSNGQLAREFIRKLQALSASYAAPGEQEGDITDAAAVRKLMDFYRPDVVLNCAAYNQVDLAERERSAAFRVNADGPRILAEEALRIGAWLVHFSSDYVFDGAKQGGLYTEDDPARPLNVYGESKLKGEQVIRETLGDRSLVLRLSWVFGDGVQNFVFKFLERVRTGKPLAVTVDEVSVPTWTGTVVEIALKAVRQGMTGLFHLTNSGRCSRLEWAKSILRLHGIERPIDPITMASLGLPAKRPPFSAMSNERLAHNLGISIASWEEALRECEKGRILRL
jgi:dTDP-4-dehydrorhamnose reductase